MNQTSIIAASLTIGFIVFITVRGELPAYLAVFGIGSSNSASNQAAAKNSAAMTTQAVNPMTTGPLGNIVNQPPFGGTP